MNFKIGKPRYALKSHIIQIVTTLSVDVVDKMDLYNLKHSNLHHVLYECKTPNCPNCKHGGTLECTHHSIFVLHHCLHTCPSRTVDVKN